jgi:hypothetical protein
VVQIQFNADKKVRGEDSTVAEAWRGLHERTRR